MSKIMIWLAAAAALAASGAAFAQTATAGGNVSIIDQFAVTNESALGFGTIILPSSGSNVIAISAADGTRSISGAGNATALGGGASRAVFSLLGEGALPFDIAVPAGFTLERSGGAETIAVTLSASALSGITSGAPGSEGTATFGVGGSLQVSSATVPGLYQGSFTISVDNQ